jgi:hypothetical protein
LFVLFDRPDVPPTNNASEQDLRPSVIHRKVTGGYRSQLGADVSAIVTSLLTTAASAGSTSSTPCAPSPAPHRFTPPACPREQCFMPLQGTTRDENVGAAPLRWRWRRGLEEIGVSW